MVTTAAPIESPGETAADPLLSPGGSYVVGFDGSQASLNALRWVTDRASSGTHEVVLVGVTDEPGEPRGTEGGPLEFAGMLARRAREMRARHDVASVSTRLASGSVPAALAAAVRPGDLLVIGSDKTGYAQGRVYGVRSVEVAATATGIVVVVPAVDLRMRSGVVVGVDDEPGAVDLVSLAVREAVGHRSQLLLVHAVPRGSGTERRARGEHVLARARLAAWEEEPGVQVSAHLVARRPADAILNLSRDRALLVVGRSQHRGPLGVGTTLHEVLINANVPTAVVP